MAATRSIARGLTMLELAITIAVLAVLGALAAPQMAARLDHQRLRSAAEVLAGDVAEARFLAAERDREIHLGAHVGRAWCWTVATAPGCGCDAGNACLVHAGRAADHPGVTLIQGGTVNLEPSGQASVATLALFESRHGEQLRVDVGAMGRARLCAVKGRWPLVPAC
ncbi:MAG: prepilin-type N-terminal cleavage/methylation domain-containing protein [Burkholderiales bacterium]|nr:prepilin-type N-terminal cleavage/methylation domain-containing protein [Burkholderiales bacterium]MDE1927239.1 prepilin-type N-terminal cleavage/methylation domain-containing protein [Burkholderiales bacterium]MDE2158995.1 prepilin-type N-terminal cleavage/methylation domain-containing protein [Burkholderiales bacterium]MDE2501581.1 prepilin-type N-terminal cleavage/methylation domain-containing protein [Burkholderiales bacterium]